jgi:hypothetical protein
MQKYSEGRDRQLARMHEAVRWATEKLEQAEATALERARAADEAVMQAAVNGASRVNADATAAVSLALAQVRERCYTRSVLDSL